MIIGCSGAGKSTLSRELHQILGIELYHLDQYFWQSGWVETPHAEWKQSLQDILQRPQWIMDGNFGSSMEERLQHADTIIFLDFSRWICLYRALKRIIGSYGKTRPDMAPGCPERFDWKFFSFIFHFPEKHRPAILERLKKKRPEVRVYWLKTPAEVRFFLGGLR